MFHFMMDAFLGYRSRLDDILLVHELLEEIPIKMGLKPVMQPFLLPYYNGVVPEDCGISAFIFLAGGHFTIHTFSFREAYFVDLLYPQPLDTNRLMNFIKNAFPAEKMTQHNVERNQKESFPTKLKINEALDFGPHLFLDFNNYQGLKSLDDLFELFDALPGAIGMTPIMRPYGIKGKYQDQKILSIMTMIAESHISLHYFPDKQQAYFDLFSCRFFDYMKVSGKLKEVFNSDITNEILIPRGSDYQQFRNVPDLQTYRSKAWLENLSFH
ncbi:MAG: S-adenosylmethionine decarboxylase [Firmicutes bacterium]|nr:S-adenosylmethionine decarboxylase [Bacillota bacterium]